MCLALKGATRILESVSDTAVNQDAIGLNETEVVISLFALASQVEDIFDDCIKPAQDIERRRLVALATALDDARETMAKFYANELEQLNSRVHTGHGDGT
jgi:hypothetical protein